MELKVAISSVECVKCIASTGNLPFKKMLKDKRFVYGPSAQVPSHMHFGQEILDRMRQHDNIIALINADTGESLTYRQLAQQTIDVALSLVRMGVRKGDVVSICSEKRIEMMPTILGIFSAGATFSPTDNTFGSDQFLHRVKLTKPKIIFCSPNAFDHYKTSINFAGIEQCIVYDEERDGEIIDGEKKHDGILFKEFLSEHGDIEEFLPVPVDGWKDYLIILFSSGTTGLPKGVPITHMGFLINSVCYTNESYKGSALMITREWYNNYELLYTFAALREGATVVFSTRNTHADFLAAIQKCNIKYLQLTPTSVMELGKSPIIDNYDVSSVEAIVSSSTPIMADQVEAIKKRMPNIKSVYQMYGLCEASCVCTELHASPRSGSVGTPAPGVVLQVVDLKTREPLGPGERGEICLKSPALTPGYLGDPRDIVDVAGFYATGDVGYYDGDGYFYVVSRIKEMIKFNDIAVAPAELESILLLHPSVAEAGVTGVPHAEWGEAPAAVVVLRPGSCATEDELVQFVDSRVTFRMRLAGGVRIVDRLPHKVGGKLDRPALKELIN